ncbi:MAG: hypothetical protein HFF09_06860 [Oscillospiraceae bacterium]|nr:hypothetical protein [Oscillospiraceae bacterium]
MAGGALSALLIPVAAVVAAVVFFTAMDNLNNGWSSEGRAQLETSVSRSCAACYAAEGRYPESLEYLEQHYGLQIDGERYVVHYHAFASNLMPEITVLERK